MTTIAELQDILKTELRSTPITSEQSYVELEKINQSESLGEVFRTVLKVLNGPVDITDSKLKKLLRANEPILLLIKKLNRKGDKVDPQVEYDAAVEFFNNKNVNV